MRVVTGGRPKDFRGAEPLGVHAEGPFLNPKKKGAHNARHLRPPAAGDVAGWSPASGMRLVTIAPELPGALDVIKALSARGVVVSTGHSMATYDEGVAGFDAGARYGTHLFNAMPSSPSRPGLPARCSPMTGDRWSSPTASTPTLRRSRWCGVSWAATA
jgi:N-acetylglucosamine-6-phosphate deacetylase